MQTCVLCEFDFENVNPPDGRCPRCGTVREESAGSQLPTQELPPQDRAADTFPRAMSALEGPNQEPLPSEVANVPNPSEAKAVSPDSSAVGVPTTLPKEIDQLWRGTIQGASDMRSTLKGPEAVHTVSDSVFAILPREVRSPLNTSDSLVDYELLDIIGQGGVGVVYSARQASIDRTVALKMLREEYRTRNEHQEKFLAEAILTGELDHPNIVPIYDLGRNKQGELFYSMKNVIGTPWDQVIGQKPIRENIDILLKVADAVAFAHSRSVVHRDLKPENVMLGSFGEVLVMDWGIAVATEGFRRTSSILRSQAMGGTPAYMAPEMAKGPMSAIGPAADVYLLGAILFEILTGSPPHNGVDVMDCLQNASKNIIRETDVTGELMEIAVRAMATLPRRRYRSVKDFQAAIRLYLSHSESLTLSENAEVELQKAVVTKDYQGFSRAVFAFDESLSLWNENETARFGLSRAKAAYAETAYEKGDFDLGLSLLDDSDVGHSPLIQKLQAAIADRNARQNRFKTIRKLAMALTAFIVIAGSIGMVVIFTLYTQASKLNADLDRSKKELQGEFEKTAEALKSEEIERANAIRSGKIADQRREEAEIAQRSAERARLESIAQRQQAEESSYFAEIGLVGASIQQNQFSIAEEILRQQEKSAAKSKIRHWEWGRHRFLVQGGSSDDPVESVRAFPVDDSVECIDRSADGKLLAIGKLTGECELWRIGEQQPFARFKHGRSLTDLDFNSSGNLLASSGLDEENNGAVCIWRIQEGQEAVREKKLPMKSGPAMAVAFSNGPSSEYVAAGDNKRVGRIWKWKEDLETVLLGHIDSFTSIEFSPNNDFVVSSSIDGTVRLWRTSNGSEVQQFNAHQAPVMSATFAPSGLQVASAGADRRILLWTVEPNQDSAQRVADVVRQLRGEKTSQTPYRSFEGHNGTVQEVAFSSDGMSLVSSANDNEVLVWNASKASIDQPARPQQRLRGHGGWVRACRFTADGREVLSGSDDRSWRIWRLESYREKQILTDDSPPILDADYSPSLSVAATAHADGTVVLWNPKTGEHVAKLSDGHEYLTNKARVKVDGSLIATAAADNTLRLWDFQRGTQLAVMENAGRDGIFALSPNGDWLVAAGDELGVGIWNLGAMSQPTRIRAWPPNTTGAESGRSITPVSSVAISAEGKLALVGDKLGTIEFWDVAKGTLTGKVFGHSEAIVGCFCLPSEAQAASRATAITVSSDGSVAWWDCDAGKELPRERLRHFSSVQLASLSPNGQFLATYAPLDEKKARLWIWDLKSGEKLATKDLEGLLLQDLVFSSTSDPTVFVTTSDTDDSQKKICRWNGRTDEWLTIGSAGMTSASLLGAVPLEDDNSLLTYGGRGARLWRMNDGKELKSFRPSSAIRAICFDASGNMLVSASEDGTAVIWDVAKQISTQKLFGGHSGAIRDIAFSADNQTVITSGADGRIVVWNVSNGAQINSGRISESKVVGNALQISPDGKTMALGCDDGSLRLYDALTLTQVNEFTGHAAAINGLSFSSDGRWIVTGSQDKTIRVWSLPSGKKIAKLLGHSAPLASVAFSSDGLRVLSSSQDTTVRLWDIGRMTKSNAVADELATDEGGASLGEVLSLEFHESEATVAEFSPDGRTILTAGVDGKAVLWPSEKIPPSIRISNPNQTYQDIEGLKRVDPLAVLCQPGTFDLDGATLELKLDGNQASFGQIAIDTSDGLFAVEDGRLVFQSPTKPPVAIGTLTALDASNLQVTFSSFASHSSVEELIRHIAFQITPAPDFTADASMDIVISILDREGHTGNFQPERVRILRTMASD